MIFGMFTLFLWISASVGFWPWFSEQQRRRDDEEEETQRRDGIKYAVERIQLNKNWKTERNSLQEREQAKAGHNCTGLFHHSKTEWNYRKFENYAFYDEAKCKRAALQLFAFSSYAIHSLYLQLAISLCPPARTAVKKTEKNFNNRISFYVH